MCPKCFEVNDPAATFCIECGAPLSDDPASEGSDQEVYREITQANLHRIRGDYKPAIEVCLSILKRFPNNGTAHTLLGDIYAEKGELEQAAQWFEMALDLRPESENDRRKLEAVQRRQAEQEAASTAQQLGIPESRPRTQQYLFVMVILVAIVGVASFMLGGAIARADDSTNTTIEEPIILGQSDKQEPAPELTEPVQTETVWPGTMAEQALQQALKQNAAIGPNIVSVREDPRGPSLFVTATQGSFAQPADACVEIARSVFAAYPGYAVVSIRVISGEQTIYAADVTRADWQRTTDEGLDPAAMITNVWPVAPVIQNPEGTGG